MHEPLNKKLNFNDFSNKTSQKQSNENIDNSKKKDESLKVWQSITAKGNSSTSTNFKKKENSNSSNENSNVKIRGKTVQSKQKYDKPNNINRLKNSPEQSDDKTNNKKNIQNKNKNKDVDNEGKDKNINVNESKIRTKSKV